MSLNKFVKLFNALDAENSLNNKVDLLISYFELNNEINNIWTISLLMGKVNKRYLTGKLLRIYYSQIYNLPIWLIENCYSKVGDSAEVISLLLKGKVNERDLKKKDISLDKLMNSTLNKLSKEDDEIKKETLKYLWENIPNENHLVFNKLLTGGFRVGVSKGLITKSIAKMVSIDQSIILHRLMGNIAISVDTYKTLINKKINNNEFAYKPYPFQLAKNFEENIKKQSVKSFQFEWKWDGIRSQIIKRGNDITIWTRGEEIVDNSFPELIDLISSIDDNVVFDGEIIAWDKLKDSPKDFSFLQKRLGRKSPSLKIKNEIPVIFMAYDLLEINGKDIRDNILSERRSYLEVIFKYHKEKYGEFSNQFKITQLHNITDWQNLENFRNKARNYKTEGLVIKYKNSKYLTGRKAGGWLKFKTDPMQLDGVLIYAKVGSGKRANLFTDYSFALWNDDKLVKFASAYTGLNNDEIIKLDRWIRKNTLEKFGPVRSVKPELVFEISFDNIQISNRHKSGIALRFPRISKWRTDKRIEDADTLQNAFKLLKS